MFVFYLIRFFILPAQVHHILTRGGEKRRPKKPTETSTQIPTTKRTEGGSFSGSVYGRIPRPFHKRRDHTPHTNRQPSEEATHKWTPAPKNLPKQSADSLARTKQTRQNPTPKTRFRLSKTLADANPFPSLCVIPYFFFPSCAKVDVALSRFSQRPPC